MCSVQKAIKRILRLKCSYYRMTILGMVLCNAYTEMSIYRMITGREADAVKRLQTALLYLSFSVVLLIMLCTLIWEWLKDCVKEFRVFVLCGQTNKDLQKMLLRIFLVWYLAAFLASSMLFILSAGTGHLDFVLFSAGSAFVLLLLLLLIFLHILFRRYHHYFQENL